MPKQSGLGKGLDALIPDYNFDYDDDKAKVELRVIDIEPNKDQPRKHMDKDKLESLAESIRNYGVIQPIVVKQTGNTYQIVAGERRWRAAKLAGLKNIPVVIRDVSGSEITELALIENLQREDLNPIETALSYRALMDEHRLTQEKISERIGKSRSSIANSLRLLSLTNDIKEYIATGELSEGHAKVLLSLENVQEQEELAEQIVLHELSVRETERIVKRMLEKQEVPELTQPPDTDNISAHIEAMEREISEYIGTRVKISAGKNKGRIIIQYHSNEEFERLYNLLKPESGLN